MYDPVILNPLEAAIGNSSIQMLHSKWLDQPSPLSLDLFFPVLVESAPIDVIPLRLEVEKTSLFVPVRFIDVVTAQSDGLGAITIRVGAVEAVGSTLILSEEREERNMRSERLCTLMLSGVFILQ